MTVFLITFILSSIESNLGSHIVFSYCLSSFFAAITEYHTLGSLRQTEICYPTVLSLRSPRSGGQHLMRAFLLHCNMTEGITWARESTELMASCSL